MLTHNEKMVVTKIKQNIESFENTGDPFFLMDLGVLIHMLWEKVNDANSKKATSAEADLH